MAECWDCFYCESVSSNGGMSNKWFCRKKHKTVEGDAAACSNFVHEDAPSCLDCAYAEADTRPFAKIGAYNCTKRNRKVKSDDLACSQFVAE